jgi:1-acyl-sn-glycerol-3-phosphate acyltransferase
MIALRVRFLIDARPDRAGAVTRRWCRAVFRAGTFRVSVEGLAAVERLPSAVFVANHASYMDALLLRAVLPGHVRMVAKEGLLRYPFVGALFGASGVIPIARGRDSAADRLSRVVREGGSFAIFPEGTFRRAPGLLPFRLGAFRAAVDAGSPVVPVALKGTREAWPDETLLVRRLPLEVVFGAPIRPSGAGWPEMVRLRDAARAFLSAEVGEPMVEHDSSDSLARVSGNA